MEYPVGANSLVGIEHPFIIGRISEAIRTLGGSRNVEKIVASGNVDNEATLYLKPDDPLSMPISSHNTATNDLLLAITVPRIVGRKRKRPSGGSASMTQESSNEIASAERLRRCFKDHPQQIQMSVVGSVDQTHRFRDLPDFGFASSTGNFVKQFQEKLLSFDYDLIKQYRFDLTNPKNPTTEIIPPPMMSPVTMPFNYAYRQNHSARRITQDSGRTEIEKDAKSQRTHLIRVASNVPAVPHHPSPNTPPLESLDKDARELVAELKILFDRRPIWTRRAIVNQLRKPLWRNMFKAVHQYVAYMFRSGPWREAMVKLGVDPRQDPSYRKYQTMFFILESDVNRSEGATPKKPGQSRGGARLTGVTKTRPFGVEELGNQTHVFDGEKVALDSKVWQICDITDPLIVSVLDVTNLRKSCHLKSDGWFHNGTWAKARLIARTKMLAITRGDLMLYQHSLERIAEFPDYVDVEARAKMQTSREDSPSMIELAENIRALVSSPEPLQGKEPSALAHDHNGDPRVQEAMDIIGQRSYGKRKVPSEDSDDDAGNGFAEEDYDATMVYPADYAEGSDFEENDDRYE